MLTSLLLSTCNHLSVQTDTARVVWAYHSRDPESEDELALLEHERKGSASLNLLGGLNEERVVEDSQSFTILNDNVSSKTLNSSQMFKLSKEVLNHA